MFREMRRHKQLLSAEETAKVLETCTSGVLACSGDDGYPYAVPLSYVYEAGGSGAPGKIYFHAALEGHKMDAIRSSEKVSFCVTAKDQIVPEEYTTYFRSVIAFGKARILDDPAEKRHAIEVLAAKYSPDQEEGRKKEIDDSFSRLCMVEISIDHLTGKEAIELVRAGK